VVPPSDWFWCGQPPSILLSCHGVSDVHHAPAQSQCPCSTLFLPSFRPPCSGMSICALSFVVALLGCTSPLGRASSSVPSHSSVLTTDLAWSYSGTSCRHSGSPNAPGSMPWALWWQWCSFTFAGVNFCVFDIPHIGV